MVAMSTGCVIVLHVDFTKWHHDYQRSKESSKKPVAAEEGASSPERPTTSEPGETTTE